MAMIVAIARARTMALGTAMSRTMVKVMTLTMTCCHRHDVPPESSMHGRLTQMSHP